MKRKQDKMDKSSKNQREHASSFRHQAKHRQQLNWKKFLKVNHMTKDYKGMHLLLKNYSYLLGYQCSHKSC